MRLVFISNMVPASENIGGTSALPYHLMVNRPHDVEVVIYSFNTNGLSAEKIAAVERELRVKICLIPTPGLFQKILNVGALGLLVRTLLPYPLHHYLLLDGKYRDEIIAMKPDGVWIYGEELTGISLQLPDIPQVHTGPDCEALYYERLLGKPWLGRTKRLRCEIMQQKFRRLAANAPECAAYHCVGEADVECLKRLNGRVRAKFIRHPHYNYCEDRVVKFAEPKIRLLLAGRNDLYMQGCAAELVDVLAHHTDLADCFAFTFLGKGWEQEAEKLTSNGWDCRHVTFADDYLAEICSHDIQLVPISIGTGTKGKVLDAFANGLLVIGTDYALENIAVEHGKDCLQYQSADEVVAMLGDIAANRAKYEAMAESGRAAVLKHHDRAEASRQLLSLFSVR